MREASVNLAAGRDPVKEGRMSTIATGICCQVERPSPADRRRAEAGSSARCEIEEPAPTEAPGEGAIRLQPDQDAEAGIGGRHREGVVRTRNQLRVPVRA